MNTQELRIRQNLEHQNHKGQQEQEKTGIQGSVSSKSKQKVKTSQKSPIGATKFNKIK